MAWAGQKGLWTDLRIDPQAELEAERLSRGGGAGSGGPLKGGERRGR